MPVVRILRVTGPGDETLPARAVQQLADALGEIFGSPPGTTWVAVEDLARDRYAENGAVLAAHVRPPVVDGLARAGAEPAARRSEARALAEAVAHALGRPAENTHVLSQPPAAGRIAFGGRLD
jgi:phenylpyruvate tautomerase PptA (4-oxalocrotonate tautomerase family)